MALAAASTFFAFGGVYLLCAMAGLMALFGVLKLPSRKISHDGKPKAQELLASLRLMVGNPGIMLTACVEAAILFAYGTMEVFLPLYARTIGLGVFEVGLILSGQVITLALTKPVMGRFSDRHGRAPQIIWGALAGSLCLVGVTLCTGFVGLMAASLLFGLALSVVTSATSAAIADLSQCETRGSAMGIFGTVMDIGHSSGPIALRHDCRLFRVPIGVSRSRLHAGYCYRIFWDLHCVPQEPVILSCGMKLPSYSCRKRKAI